MSCGAKMCTSKARLDGKVVVITGANTGIGFETALELVRRGATVISGCRNMEKAAEAAKKIKTETGVDVNMLKLDLSSLESVRGFAKEVLAATPKINYLINNAGIMMVPQAKTVDGFESQFATNHLGHFLLTLLLLDRIKESAPARIVILSSIGHTFARDIDFDDINMDKNYTPMRAYAQSKLANVLFGLALVRRLGPQVNVYSVHPGAVDTELDRTAKQSNMLMNVGLNISRLFYKSPTQGAQTSVYCTVAEELDNVTGKYYSDCSEKKPSKRARDVEVAERLYKVSLEMVGLPAEK